MYYFETCVFVWYVKYVVFFKHPVSCIIGQFYILVFGSIILSRKREQIREKNKKEEVSNNFVELRLSFTFIYIYMYISTIYTQGHKVISNIYVVMYRMVGIQSK